ncbi:MAG: ribbon-helix-helix domain-containing protein [Gemmatimonadaceae bacterium]|nr:ribbon-helix-helix domain-containing protein [Gemmatimonadaceae bacterium]
MPRPKIALTLDDVLLARIDRLVRQGVFANRSRAIEAAVAGHLARLERRRLITECAKLSPAAERAMADEGLDAEAGTWPAY